MELTPSAERIVDAAERLIQALGYNGFSYEDVAKIVGIRKPSIHHHFPSKADLGTVVVQRYTQRFMQKLADILCDESSVLNRLKAYVRLFEMTYTNHHRFCLCGMLGAESDSLPGEVNRAVQGFFVQNLAWLSTVLQAGLSVGEITLHNQPEALAECFLSALEGSMVLGRGCQSAHGPEQVAETFFSLMRV